MSIMAGFRIDTRHLKMSEQPFPGWKFHSNKEGRRDSLKFRIIAYRGNEQQTHRVTLLKFKTIAVILSCEPFWYA